MSDSVQTPTFRSARARRAATLVAGWLLLVSGTVLLVLPGPGLLLILGGLALLGRELVWARSLRQRIETMVPRRHRREPAPEDRPLSVRNVIE